MNDYHQSKTARRVAAVVYLAIMLFILGGTYLSEQHKTNTQNTASVQIP